MNLSRVGHDAIGGTESSGKIAGRAKLECGRLDRMTALSKAQHKEHTSMKPKNTICLWFDKDAHEAARFYAATFPDSKVTAVHKAPATSRAARRAMC